MKLKTLLNDIHTDCKITISIYKDINNNSKCINKIETSLNELLNNINIVKDYKDYYILDIFTDKDKKTNKPIFFINIQYYKTNSQYFYQMHKKGIKLNNFM